MMAKRTKAIGPRVVSAVFDGIGAIAGYLEATPLRYDHDIATMRSDAWNGNVSLREALDLARHGAPATREAWATSYKADFPQAGAAGPATDYDVGGAYPDVGRAVAGDPACMVAPGFATETKPIIGLYLAKFVSAMVPEYAIRNQGLAILAHIDAAEAQGYRVEVNAVMRATGSKGTILDVRWPVKRADEPVDLDKLAFAIAHPAMTRRLLFAVMDRWPGIADLTDHNQYGYPADAPDLPARCCYFAQPAEGVWSTPESAMREVSRALQEADCYVRDDPLYGKG